MLRYLAAWPAMLAIAIANGALREKTFGRCLPELRAHQLSTAIGSALMGVFIWAVIRIWPPASSRQALLVGLVWLLLTIAFEFFMGLVLLRRSWVQALSDYNLPAGRVWVLFLIWLALAPWVFFRLRAGG